MSLFRFSLTYYDLTAYFKEQVRCCIYVYDDKLLYIYMFHKFTIRKGIKS